MAIAVSMVMFDGPVKLAVGKITQYLNEIWADLPKVGGAQEHDNMVAFQLGEADVALGVIAAPMPWDELESVCEMSPLWPGAAEVLKEHREHVIVTVRGELDPVELSGLLTQVTAAVMASSEAALGVYWGNASMVVPKDMFIEFAVDILPQGPPLFVWVNFQAGPMEEEGVSGGFTTGLEALGLMELETENATESPGK